MKLSLLGIFIFIASYAYGDVGKFDIAEIELNGERYYIQFFSPGVLKNNNTIYHTYQDEYHGSSIDEVNKVLNSCYDYEFYKEIHNIEFRYFPGVSEGDSILVILKNPVAIKREIYRNNYKIISIQKGCSYGYTYSDDLTSMDNIWLSSNPVEKIMSLSGSGGMCHVNLYAPIGRLNAAEIDELKEKLEAYLNQDNLQPSKEELSKLYKKRIIMVGLCSC